MAAVEADLERAASVQMHDVFAGGAPHVPEAQREATREEALRLGIGRMVAHLVHTLDRPDGRLHLYSGHDWTVGPLLMCLCRADDPLLHQWPRFCAEVAIELWSSNPSDAPAAFWPSYGATPARREEQRYVRVLYNGEPLDLACSAEGQQLCRVADFKRMVSRYAVKCFESECTDASSSGGRANAKRY